MAFTKVVGPGIHTLSNILSHNINSSGIITATKFVGPITGGGGDFNAGILTATSLDINGNGDISGNLVVGGNLTANGDFTTLNTTLREVELLRVDADNDNVAAGIITQRGTGDILNLHDGGTAILSVKDGGNIIMGAGAGSVDPHAPLHIRTGTTGAITTLLKLHGPFTSNTGSEGTAIDFGTASDTSTGARIIGSREASGAKGALRFCTGRENDAGFNGGRMVIDETGTVGIGSTIPLSAMALDIVGSIRYSNQSRGAAGSASEPSYAFYSDHDSGMYRGGTNILSFATNGTERLRIDSTGDVRFTGTNLTNNTNKNVNLTAPSYNTSEEDVNLVQVENESGMNQISFGGGTSGLNAATTLRFLTASAVNTTTGTERLRITSGGKVGINSSSPSNTLVVQEPTDDNSSIQLFRASTGGDIASINWRTNQGNQAKINYRGGGGSEGMQFYAGGTASSNLSMVIKTDGKVAIGTHTPQSYKFEIWDDTTATLQIRKANSSRIVFSNDSQHNTLYSQTISGYADRDFVVRIGQNERLRITGTGITVTGEVAASQDYPNQRPILDFNFVAVKKLDSRITYYRTGPASFTDEFGKVVLVGDNTPRFDHDPTTRECKGLLMEVTRTNLLPYSIPNSNWNLSSATITENAGIAPDGTNTAVLHSDNTTNNQHLMYMSGVSVSNATNYVITSYLKQPSSNSRRYYSLTIHGLGYVIFDVQNGTVHNSSGTGIQGGSITAVGNGWYRVKAHYVTNNTTGNIYWLPIADDGTNVVYTGTGQGMLVWGCQLEQATYETSYIPTNGTTVTRGSEYAVIDGEDFTDFYNPVESSVLAVGTMQRPIAAQGQLNIFHIGDDNEDGHGVFREHGTKDVWYHIRNNNSTPTGGNLNPSGFGDWDAGEEARIAIAFKDGDQAISVNGGNQVTASVTTNYPSSDITKMWIGSHGTGSFFEGIIKRIAYYPKQLTDNQLNTLTS